jgi:hypothetical protein
LSELQAQLVPLYEAAEEQRLKKEAEERWMSQCRSYVEEQIKKRGIKMVRLTLCVL